MTHAEFLAAHPTPGILASSCEGTMALLYRIADVDPLAPPQERTIMVEVHRCERCRTHVSLDASRGRIFNTYRFVDPEEMAADLASSFELRRGGGGGGGEGADPPGGTGVGS